MDKKLYQEAIDYELLTKEIYQKILQSEDVTNVDVKHDTQIKGRSGVDHQVDISWQFKQAGLQHTVLIECKNYASTITLEKIRNFFAVLHDIGNCRGIMVTKTGYQEGALQFANFYGIDLKLLREPTEEDWKGKIKDIHITLTTRSVVSTNENPIQMSIKLKGINVAQQERLSEAKHQINDQIAETASLRFVDKKGIPITEEMRWWLPKHLNTLDKPTGGPYEERIYLEDHYLPINLGFGIEFACVESVTVKFYVKLIDKRESCNYGEQIVKAILKDFLSKEVEYVKINN